MSLLDAALDRQLHADAGISHGQYAILSRLSQAPGRMLHMSALAAMTSTSASRLSHAVTRLEELGWVRRSRCPDNQRWVHATLTEPGYRLLVSAAPGHVAEVRRLLFDHLSRAALTQRQQTGVGQVVDAAMVDGASLLDSGAPFYDTYATADGRYVAVGALEPAFYAELIGGLGLAEAPLPAQYDRAGWPVLRQRFTEIFLTRSRDEWASAFRDTDACVSPVLSFDEALENDHIRARGTITRSDGMDQAAPAPRFSSSPRATLDVPPPLRRANLNEVLQSWQPPGD